MATYNWKNVPPTKPKFCGIEVPDGVEGIFSWNIRYQDYSLRFSKESKIWQLIDDHGTVIGRFSDTEEDKRRGFLGLLRQPAEDQKATMRVLIEEKKYLKELDRESFPKGMGPWAAAALYDLKSGPNY